MAPRHRRIAERRLESRAKTSASREPVHPTEVSLERLQIRRDLDARELDVQRETLVPLPFPDVRVERDEALREIGARGRDSVPRQGEALRVYAPAVHGPPDLVRRERRDRGAEPHEVPQASVERPP